LAVIESFRNLSIWVIDRIKLAKLFAIRGFETGISHEVLAALGKLT